MSQQLQLELVQAVDGAILSAARETWRPALGSTAAGGPPTNPSCPETPLARHQTIPAPQKLALQASNKTMSINQAHNLHWQEEPTHLGQHQNTNEAGP